MDTLGIEPRDFRMRSGCDTATPCAHTKMVTTSRTTVGLNVSILIHMAACTGFALQPRDCILRGSPSTRNPKAVLNYTPEA